MKFAFQRCPIILPVKLVGPAGEGEASLLLDTGAYVTVINTRVLAMLGARPVPGDRRIVLTTAEGNIQVPLVKIDRLEFMGVKRETVTVAAHDLPANAKVDGLLGTDLLADLLVTINFASNELEISQP